MTSKAYRSNIQQTIRMQIERRKAIPEFAAEAASQQKTLERIAGRGYHLFKQPADAEGRTFVLLGYGRNLPFHRITDVKVRHMPDRWGPL